MLPNESYGLARSLGVTDDYDRYWLYKDHWRPDIPHAKALRALELETSLPDALLTKVDRVSMRCSLEVRVPFLSTELVNYAFSLKDEVFTLNRTPKYLLRQLGMKYLPMEICTASKKGFGIPPSLRLSKDGSRCSVQYKTLVEQHSFEYLAKVIK
jgi:asparagine synthase (glutamine-hydrolysing)